MFLYQSHPLPLLVPAAIFFNHPSTDVPQDTFLPPYIQTNEILACLKRLSCQSRPRNYRMTIQPKNINKEQKGVLCDQR